jgi:hypothetical protein
MLTGKADGAGDKLRFRRAEIGGVAPGELRVEPHLAQERVHLRGNVDLVGNRGGERCSNRGQRIERVAAVGQHHPDAPAAQCRELCIADWHRLVVEAETAAHVRTGRQQAEHRADEEGLAGAGGADQPDALSLADRKTDAVEQRLAAQRDRQIVELKQRHRRPRRGTPDPPSGAGRGSRY